MSTPFCRDDPDFVPPQIIDEDREYDDFVQRCIEGAQCIACHEEAPQIATEALGFKLWRCPHCGNEGMRL